MLLLPQFVHLGGRWRLWVHVWGEDRQPVPRAKLFCLRFCGRIGFVARFTLTLDKHLLSVLDWGTMGGAEVRRGPGRAIILAGRPRRTIISGITPKAAAPGWCTEYIRNVLYIQAIGLKGIFGFGWVRPSEAKWLLLYIVLVQLHTYQVCTEYNTLKYESDLFIT